METQSDVSIVLSRKFNCPAGERKRMKTEEDYNEQYQFILRPQFYEDSDNSNYYYTSRLFFNNMKNVVEMSNNHGNYSLKLLRNE